MVERYETMSKHSGAEKERERETKEVEGIMKITLYAL